MIFGLFRTDKQPVTTVDLASIRLAMACFPHHCAEDWRHASIGFGRLLRYNTPESIYENLPCVSNSGRYVLVADARLDNRDELFDLLSVPLPERKFMPDSSLILKAYERWEEECPHHLLGDWSFALWDHHLQQLFIARDQIGAGALYYYQNAHFIVFSSALKGVMALPGVPSQLNELAVAQLAAGQRRDAQTFYKDVYQLPAGQWMAVNAQRTVRQYHWRPQDIQPVTFANDQDYLDAFLEIYTQAVSCRLRSHGEVAVTLSGGLDSGSVASLAARQRAQSGERLRAISWRPADGANLEGVPTNRRADETSLIEATSRHAGNIDVSYIQHAYFTPLSAIDYMLDTLLQPPFTFSAWYWFMSLLKMAQQQNIATLLTGQAGNFTVSWQGNRDSYLLGLLRSGRFGTLAHEVRLWAQHQRRPLWCSMASQLIRPLFAPLHRPHGREGRRFIRAEAAAPVLRTQAPYDAELMARQKQAAEPLCNLIAMFQSGKLSLSPELGRCFGVDERAPVLDKRLVAFCFGIPQRQYTRDGQEKLLLRQSMHGIMPDEVLYNRHRGLIAGDLDNWMWTNRAEIVDILQHLKNSPTVRHWLDLGLLNDALQHCEIRGVEHLHQGVITLRGILIGRFLMQFD